MNHSIAIGVDKLKSLNSYFVTLAELDPSRSFEVRESFNFLRGRQQS